MTLEGIDSSILVLMTGAMTILASVLAQVMINRQKRNDFLKEKSWDKFQVLVDSLSSLSIYVDKALDSFDYLNGEKKEVDVSQVFESFAVMKEAQSYVYMTGRNSLIRAYNELYDLLDSIEKYYDKDGWELNLRMRYQKITPLSINLIKEISRFMGS